MKKAKNISVVGAGLVGSLISIYLAKRGYNVKVFERRPDFSKTGAIGGRSINLALSDRGWKALEGVGVGQDIKDIAIPMHGRMMHDLQGNLKYQPYGKEGQAIYSVSRGELNARLSQLAEGHQNVSISYDQTCLDVDLEAGSILFKNTVTGKETKESADLIVGTDGAFSAVRTAMQKTNRFNYSQEYMPHGYKELTIPAAEGGGWRLDKNALHIWPRGSYMLIALPNLDGSFTCTLFLPFEGGEDCFERLTTPAEVTAFFARVFPDALPLMPTLTQDFFNNPSASLVLIKCNPWTYKNKAFLVGDACHAIVPFYGQGMNAGFEDCTVLSQLLDKHADDWDAILPEYQSLRIPDADGICDLALRNFIEMRDKVADEKFLLQKQIEAEIHRQFPDKWLPLYSMVTFSHIRYSEALRLGKIQDEIMAEVLAIPGIASGWKNLDYGKIIPFEKIK